MRAALEVLRQIGPDAKPAVQAIVRVADYSQIFLRRAAVTAIKAVDPELGKRYRE